MSSNPVSTAASYTAYLSTVYDSMLNDANGPARSKFTAAEIRRIAGSLQALTGESEIKALSFEKFQHICITVDQVLAESAAGLGRLFGVSGLKSARARLAGSYGAFVDAWKAAHPESTKPSDADYPESVRELTQIYTECINNGQRGPTGFSGVENPFSVEDARRVLAQLEVIKDNNDVVKLTDEGFCHLRDMIDHLVFVARNGFGGGFGVGLSVLHDISRVHGALKEQFINARNQRVAAQKMTSVPDSQSPLAAGLAPANGLKGPVPGKKA